MTARVCLLILIVLPLGCAGARQRVAYAPTRAVPEARCIVFSVDGAGNFQGVSTALKEFVAAEQLPIHVHTFEWSHGYRRILSDHLDQGHARKEGSRLAEAIRCYRDSGDGPPLPIHIVAHSAGCMVTLYATEQLPPDAVEHIVFLAPSVSAKYDIRPALRSARKGVEVFHSRRDRAWLGLGMAVLGTSDGRRTSVSGRVGFQVPDDPGADGVLYSRLHQHPWQEDLMWTGNTGGHFGIYQPGYLKAYVAPLLRE